MVAQVPPPTDLELIGRAQAGDRAAIDEVVRRHTPIVYGIVSQLKVFGIVEKADLIQEGLMALVRAISHWRPGESAKFSTYAWRAVHTAVREELRRQLQAPEPIDPFGRLTVTDEMRKWGPARVHLAELTAPTQSELPDLTTVLEALPPLASRLLTLRFGLEGEAVGWLELARRFGLTVPQARELVDDALASAREVLESWEE